MLFIDFNMKYLSILFSIILIIYELYKILYIHKYWSNIIDKTPTFIKIFEFLYAFFIISLLFHTWFWQYSMCLLILSLMVGLSISPDVISKHKLTRHLKLLIRFEAVVSIVIIFGLIHKVLTMFF